MTDETPKTDITPQSEPVKPSAGTQNTETPQEENRIPYARFKEVNEEANRLKSELQKLQDAENKRQAELAKQKEAELKEQQKWQELADKREKELNDLRTQLETERLNGLKTRIGNEFKLPAAIIARLVGANEDEIRKDAEALHKELGLDKPAETPATPQAQQQRRQTTTPVPDGQSMGYDAAQRRAQRKSYTSPIFTPPDNPITFQDGEGKAKTVYTRK